MWPLCEKCGLQLLKLNVIIGAKSSFYHYFCGQCAAPPGSRAVVTENRSGVSIVVHQAESTPIVTEFTRAEGEAIKAGKGSEFIKAVALIKSRPIDPALLAYAMEVVGGKAEVRLTEREWENRRAIQEQKDRKLGQDHFEKVTGYSDEDAKRDREKPIKFVRASDLPEDHPYQKAKREFTDAAINQMIEDGIPFTKLQLVMAARCLFPDRPTQKELEFDLGNTLMNALDDEARHLFTYEQAQTLAHEISGLGIPSAVMQDQAQRDRVTEILAKEPEPARTCSKHGNTVPDGKMCSHCKSEEELWAMDAADGHFPVANRRLEAEAKAKKAIDETGRGEPIEEPKKDLSGFDTHSGAIKTEHEPKREYDPELD